MTPSRLAFMWAFLAVFVLGCGSSKQQEAPKPPATGDVDTSCCSDISDDEKALVARYTPVLQMAQDDYDPMEVQAFFNEPGRRGEKPDGCLTDVTPRPAGLNPGDCPTEATVLANRAQRLRFNIVGGNLSNQATYQDIYRTKIVPKYAAVTYAEVKSTGNLVTIDYWFFYLANFSIGNIDNHEGDWERAQVRIQAPSVGDAAKLDPARDGAKLSLAASRHRCDSNQNMPARDWSTAQHDGTHPIVYVGAGSHANYFDAGGNGGQQPLTLVDGACFLGSAGDATPAQRRLAPSPVLIDCAASKPAWVTFAGGWGVEGPRGPCQHR